jgi:hypothetical protein
LLLRWPINSRIDPISIVAPIGSFLAHRVSSAFSQGQAMPGFGLEPNHVTCGEKTAVDKRTYWRSTYGDNQTARQNLETAENAERAAAYRQGREEGAERCGTS